ncbi:Folate transporter 1-like Protein [Tribolium castaneum]|uniref:Folate transporter 1-like Protein n=1 Tax=Tribolium castaneum TaxID=7070 RepID=D6WJH6_TRICA|nr:Folate transporter 1-like Protein [Tribolium castaneum]
MNDWFKISLLLSIFGFLKEIRPSEPFVYEFLVGPWRNVSKEEVTEQVYPVGTYSYLAQSIVAFLITDLCRYKPLIVLLGLSGVVVWSMLLWTKSLFELQVLEVFYGTFMATEVAYYTYIYAKVPKEFYQQVTSHTRAAILAGRAISGIVAQLLISLDSATYRDLNYITFSSMLAATLWSLFLPSVRKTIYFHREIDERYSRKFLNAFTLMKTHLVESFSNRYVLKWSFWWALSTCGFIQVQCYMQVLWNTIQDDPTIPIYNGAVESVLTVLGFMGALLAGVLRVDWKMKGELALTLCSLMSGFILLYTSRTKYVILSYICYIAFGGLYHFMITIASAEIAKCIKEDSYGLVFGINTFVALAFQSILTMVVVTKGVGFALGPRNQYFVYGIFHIAISVIYIAIGLASWLSSKRDYRKADS